ncbi:hypothetical protein EZS27_031779 [termite gut metagenome]|uniref:Uncharacterized protein n=1 Tax=termite gut metagenome TaxID=433724 RepID=A0A5J4QC70_9ZZZZ
MEVTWFVKAKIDLIGIGEYISKNSTQSKADEVIHKIYIDASNLGRHPNMGRVIVRIGDCTIRQLISGNYKIVYKVDGDEVLILAVYHSARLFSNVIDLKDYE